MRRLGIQRIVPFDRDLDKVGGTPRGWRRGKAVAGVKSSHEQRHGPWLLERLPPVDIQRPGCGAGRDAGAAESAVHSVDFT